jgi:hypothetical protein
MHGAVSENLTKLENFSKFSKENDDLDLGL